MSEHDFKTTQAPAMLAPTLPPPVLIPKLPSPPLPKYLGRVRERIHAVRKEIACDILDGIYTTEYKLMTLKSSDPVVEVLDLLSLYFDQSRLHLDEHVPPSITLRRSANTIEPHAPEYVRCLRASINTALEEVSRDTLMDSLRTCYRLIIFKPGDPRDVIFSLFAEHFREGSLSITDYTPGGINYYPHLL